MMESANLLTALLLPSMELKGPDGVLPSGKIYEEILGVSGPTAESFSSWVMIFSAMLGQTQFSPNISFQDFQQHEKQKMGSISQLMAGGEVVGIFPLQGPSLVFQRGVPGPNPEDVKLNIKNLHYFNPANTLSANENDILPFPALPKGIVPLADPDSPFRQRLETGEDIFPKSISLDQGAPSTLPFRGYVTDEGASMKKMNPYPNQREDVSVQDLLFTRENDEIGIPSHIRAIAETMEKEGLEEEGSYFFKGTNIPGDLKSVTDLPPKTPETFQKNAEPVLPEADPIQIYELIGKKMGLSLKNNEQKIRLALEPPHLGNLQIEIRKEESHIRAIFWADNPVTKEILEANQSQLHKTLEENGIRLEKFDVFVQQDTKSFQEWKGKSVDQRLWGKRKHNEDSLSIESSETTPVAAVFFHTGSKYIDQFI